MGLPLFYIDQLTGETALLNEETSKHITQILRMKVGERVSLTDGKGTKAEAIITDDHKKKCEVQILNLEKQTQPKRTVSIAISLLKNSARYEWFLEKATEIGVAEILPLICDRTEKEKFRFDRLNQILISAMLQSQQCWLPTLHQPVLFSKLIEASIADPNFAEQRFIAHCSDANKNDLLSVKKQHSSIILIGPEGDFTVTEIELAIQNGFMPVTLGNTRLRTETAGIVAATLLCNTVDQL
jgi:16S rRNA (uracil1498-N3)-methyltransferase